jgi:hypothetical protein
VIDNAIQSVDYAKLKHKWEGWGWGVANLKATVLCTMRNNVGKWNKEGEGETNQGGERQRANNEAQRLG